MKEFAFMVFCFGFFLYTIKMVFSESDKEYHRKLNEQREFGYRDPTKPLRDPPKK